MCCRASGQRETVQAPGIRDYPRHRCGYWSVPFGASWLRVTWTLRGKGRADHLAKAKPKTGVAVRSGMENWVTVADGLRSIWHKREKQTAIIQSGAVRTATAAAPHSRILAMCQTTAGA
jgi:hypothetical protein